jgi:hypothetical protein
MNDSLKGQKSHMLLCYLFERSFVLFRFARRFYINGGPSKCSTNPLYLQLSKLLTAIKESLQRYCSTSYSRSGVNQMRILKILKELLENLKSYGFTRFDSIKMNDFSTLYTTIPHNKLKYRLSQIIDVFGKQKWHSEIQISSDWETRYIFCETPL